MSTICNIVASYLGNLSATHAVCSALGDTLTFGTNMFIGGNNATETNIITIIPYGGFPPNIDGNRQSPAIQIRSITDSRYKALEVQQSLINTLHMNELSGRGFTQAVQSAPILIGEEKSGRYIIAISNYYIQHLKV